MELVQFIPCEDEIGELMFKTNKLITKAKIDYISLIKGFPISQKPLEAPWI